MIAFGRLMDPKKAKGKQGRRRGKGREEDGQGKRRKGGEPQETKYEANTESDSKAQIVQKRKKLISGSPCGYRNAEDHGGVRRSRAAPSEINAKPRGVTRRRAFGVGGCLVTS